MWPMGWEALEQWGDDVARIEPLAGGVANDVWTVRVNGHLAVGRLGVRSDADLAWETELLKRLDREGLTVPVPIPTTDGRLFADGVVVMTYVEGGPPETEADWRRVADTLRQLHRLTPGWPQRPGWRSSTDLLHAETGTKIDLGAMPPEGVARCRAAWARLVGRQTCVVHGDPNPRNIRMTADRVALIDWDEAHVDVPDLDLVMPHNAAGLPRAGRPNRARPGTRMTVLVAPRANESLQLTNARTVPRHPLQPHPTMRAVDRWVCGAFFERFRGFESFPFRRRVSALLPTTDASRCAAARSFKVCYSSTKVVVVHRWQLPCLCGNGHEAM